jgi:uncharacterized membrane protein YdcZ (DUF606 family)
MVTVTRTLVSKVAYRVAFAGVIGSMLVLAAGAYAPYFADQFTPLLRGTLPVAAVGLVAGLLTDVYGWLDVERARAKRERANEEEGRLSTMEVIENWRGKRPR